MLRSVTDRHKVQELTEENTRLRSQVPGGDFQITAEDTVIQTQGSVRINNAATPLFQYKNFLFGWGGSYGNEYRTAYLLTPYLASINNLSSAVVKTVDKTMKITYTLTEQPDSVP